jgi:Flp pilus assembly protein TadB
MRADGSSAPLLLLSLLTTIVLLCVAVALWRALRRVRAAEVATAARTEQLEQELAGYQRSGEEWPQEEERFRTPLERAEDYTIFLLDSTGRPTSWN